MHRLFDTLVSWSARHAGKIKHYKFILYLLSRLGRQSENIKWDWVWYEELCRSKWVLFTEVEGLMIFKHLSRTCPRQVRYFMIAYIQESSLGCHFPALCLQPEENKWPWILYYIINDVNDSIIPRREIDIKNSSIGFSQSETGKYFELIIMLVAEGTTTEETMFLL